MDTPSSILDKTTWYLSITFLGVPFVFVFNALSAGLKGVGDSKTPLLFLAFSSTVREFIDDVMRQRPKDWGRIELYSKRPSSFDDRPISSVEYRRGEMGGRFSNNDQNREIKEISADGGWSRMDYMIIVKGD